MRFFERSLKGPFIRSFKPLAVLGVEVDLRLRPPSLLRGQHPVPRGELPSSRVVFELSRDAALSRISALFFAVFQAPQEAVMWLAAMNETLAGLFALLTFLLWLRQRYALAAATFLAALVSKESALIVLVLLALTDRRRQMRAPARAWLLMAVLQQALRLSLPGRSPPIPKLSRAPMRPASTELPSWQRASTVSSGLGVTLRRLQSLPSEESPIGAVPRRGGA
jgi:hypothetical protein